MSHVTFVHGAGKQTSAEELMRAWRWALAEDGGIVLGPDDVSMVYWADLFGDEVESLDAMFAMGDLEMTLYDSWRDRLSRWASRLKRDLEREITRKLNDLEDLTMRLFVYQMHSYLLDQNGVQQDVRDRFLQHLNERQPRVVVAHSMGSVIAYDCFKRVPDCPTVPEFLTFGSPLGFPTIQRHMKPHWTPQDGYPRPTVGRWTNVFDLLDPVTVSDKGLAEDYRVDGAEVVLDHQQSNEGANRHEALDYLKGAPFRAALERGLG